MSNSLIIEESKRRFECRPESSRSCLNIDGVNETRRSAMRQLFLDGTYSISEVARKVGVSYATAKKMIESDDELRDMWETSFQANMDEVERSMIERATGDGNQIAAQQAGEFLLRHRRKEVYSESAIPTDMLKALPKIIIAPVISRSPLEPEQIESKPEVIDIDA